MRGTAWRDELAKARTWGQYKFCGRRGNGSLDLPNSQEVGMVALRQGNGRWGEVTHHLGQESTPDQNMASFTCSSPASLYRGAVGGEKGREGKRKLTIRRQFSSNAGSDIDHIDHIKDLGLYHKNKH